MARGDYPSTKQDQFVLRFPDGMRDAIKSAAGENGRSMNAEIVARLEDSFSRKFDRVDNENQRLGRRLESIERTLHQLMGRVGAEIERQNLVRSDPLRRSPEAVIMAEGRDAYRANPNGPYENPYPIDHIKHGHFRNGFRNTAMREFSSEDEMYARFPNLDRRTPGSVDDVIREIDRVLSTTEGKSDAEKALKSFRRGNPEWALHRLTGTDWKFENTNAAIAAIEKHLKEHYAANWGDPETAGEEAEN